MGLVDRTVAGDIRAVARLATHIENDTDVGRTALERLYPRTGRAHILGITGSPGAGKSTLINGLLKTIRESDLRVGVIAIDPTSPVSGGAALGDRIRMLENWADPGVFIRSMASRGRHGGLAPATVGLTHLLDAAGFDLIIVETVGVGQEEVDVADHVHTAIVLQVPGLGDDVQMIKAGLLEVPDIFVVNKSDQPGADDVARGLRALVGPLRGEPRRWIPPIVKVSASTGDGVGSLMDAIDQHREYLLESGVWEERVAKMARAELRALMWRELIRGMKRNLADNPALEEIVIRVAQRQLSPLLAAQRLVAQRVGLNA